jgi:hypothetical protein
LVKAKFRPLRNIIPPSTAKAIPTTFFDISREILFQWWCSESPVKFFLLAHVFIAAY